MKQYFDKPIIHIIKNRHSVRTFKPESLDKEVKGKLKAYAADIKGPFESRVRLELVDSEALADKTAGKIGTYGIIKGAKTYVAGVTGKGRYSMEQLGYSLQKLMLYAESMGLGSCWLGGTFKRSQFAELAGLKDNEFIPAVTPIGYPADKKAVVESIMRRLAGSDNRKSWNELFFTESMEKPLKQESAGDYAAALEMVRLVPSASNKQPWRILKQGNEYHFLLQHTKGYGNALGFSIQKIDMGIAMCHFEMTAVEAELKGHWMVKTQSPLISQAEDLEYIISWMAE